jgi:hypothetical protein
MDHLDIEPGTERIRRLGQGLALIVAPWAFVIANTGDVLTRHGGLDDTKARDALLISAAHPGADRWLTFAAMVGCLLLVPAVLGAMGLVRVDAARLGLLGGALMIAGYICYFALLFQGYATIALAQHGAANADNVAVQELMTDQGFYIAVALTFVAGNLVGTLLLGLALFRARVAPRWAAAFVLVWPVAHVLAGPWGEVLGASVEAVGLAAVGLCVVRGGPQITRRSLGSASNHSGVAIEHR